MFGQMTVTSGGVNNQIGKVLLSRVYLTNEFYGFT